VRSDFSIETKRILAERANSRCSRPQCHAATSGPQLDPARALNLGVAAHITAASPDGPRYNPNLTDDQRRHPDNGIWLCQNCGKLVDNDEAAFSVTLLRDWKRQAEVSALLEIGRTSIKHSGPGFTAEELDILLNAADHGDIWIHSTMQIGDWVRSGNRHFVDESDPAIAARFLDALRALRAKGLVKHQRKQWYMLTGSGFELARELKQRLHASKES
jgi:hypothetical protein